MTGYDPRRAPTSAAGAHHDYEVGLALRDAETHAEDWGYLDQAHLLVSQYEDGETGTAESGKRWWKWLPTHHKFHYLKRARETHGPKEPT